MSQDPPLILDVGYEAFASAVIERSMTVPVLVDFWAGWCGPCKALTPVLQKLVAEYAGKLVLAKVDTDAEAELAQAFGVQSLPTVKLIIEGKLADEFSGALPEAELRTFLEKHLGPPDPASPEGDEAAPLAAARAALEAGDLAAARGHLAAVEGDSAQDAEARILSARLELDAGNGELAQQILDGLSEADAGSVEARALSARLTLGSIADEQLQELEQAHEAAPADQRARIAYGRGLAQAGHFGEALEHLIECVRVDRGFDGEAARKSMVSIFDVLGPEDEMAHDYRRQLQMAMFV